MNLQDHETTYQAQHHKPKAAWLFVFWIVLFAAVVIANVVEMWIK